MLVVVGGGEVLPPLLLCMVFRQKKEKSRPPGPSGCARASAAACDDLLRSPLRPILTFFNAASRGPWAVSASARAQGRGGMQLAGLRDAGRGREGGITGVSVHASAPRAPLKCKHVSLLAPACSSCVPSLGAHTWLGRAAA